MSDSLPDNELQRIVNDPYTAFDRVHMQLAAELLAARARLAELDAQLDRVREVHQPIEALNIRYPRGRLTEVCTGCGTDDGNWQIYPCPTIRALNGPRPAPELREVQQ